MELGQVGACGVRPPVLPAMPQGHRQEAPTRREWEAQLGGADKTPDSGPEPHALGHTSTKPPCAELRKHPIGTGFHFPGQVGTQDIR